MQDTAHHIGPLESYVVLDRLASNLPELLTHDLLSEERRVLMVSPLTHPDRYVQVLSDTDGEFYLEVVSNNYLQGDDRLTSEDEEQLLAQGFSAPVVEFETPPAHVRGLPNWWFHPDCGIAGAFDVAKLIVRALHDVFGVPLRERVRVERRLLA